MTEQTNNNPSSAADIPADQMKIPKAAVVKGGEEEQVTPPPPAEPAPAGPTAAPAIPDAVKLEGQLGELSQLLITSAMKVNQPKPSDEKPAVSAKPAESASDAFSFELSEAEYDKMQDSKEGAQAVLNNFAQKFLPYMEAKIKLVTGQQLSSMEEKLLRQTGELVQNYTGRAVATQHMVSNFWRSNQDLIPFKDYVGHVATQVSSANPEATWEQIFTKTEEVVRSTLQKQKEKQNASPAGHPTDVRGTRPVPENGKPDRQRELMKMLNQTAQL